MVAANTNHTANLIKKSSESFMRKSEDVCFVKIFSWSTSYNLLTLPKANDLKINFQVDEAPKVELNHTNSGDSNHKKMEYKNVDSLQP